MKRGFFIIILVFQMLLAANLLGQSVRDITKVGTTAAPFLEIEVGSRAIAMGGAYVAAARDASALYWNPSGIARMSQGEAFLSHTKWLADTQYDFVGLVLPAGQVGTLGFMFSTLNMGEMKVRTILYPEGTGELFDANSFMFGATWARNLTDRFSIGLSAKWIHETIWHMHSSALAIDIGTLFTTPFNGLMLGMSISNFGNKLQLMGKDTQIKYDPDPTHYGNNSKIDAFMHTSAWSLPLIFRVGLAYPLLKSGSNSLILAMDAAHPNNNTEYVNVGMEYGFRNNLYLRFGYKSLFLKDSEEGLTAGAGFSYRMIGNIRVHMDYAYADFGILNSVQRFSLGILF